MSESTVQPKVETHTPKELVRVPLVSNNRSFGWITNQVAGILEGKMPRWWNVAFAISFLVTMMCFTYIGYLILTGVGVWGLNHPVAWGWAIVNFVFWIGIGHAGTLISAVLFLLRQKWRTSINRTAEAMTIFAVMCALIFPGIHIGRQWLAYWLLPLPNSSGFFGARAFTPSTSLIEHKRKVPAVPWENAVAGKEQVVLGNVPLASCWHRVARSETSLSVSSDCWSSRVAAIWSHWGRPENHLVSDAVTLLMLFPLSSIRLLFNKRHLKGLARPKLLQPVGKREGLIHLVVLKDVQPPIQ